MKAIYDKLRQFYEREIAGCKGCGGSGRAKTKCKIGAANCNKSSYQCGYFNIPNNHPFILLRAKECENALIEPCPTCAELRERLKGLCRHENKKPSGICIRCNCEGCEYKGIDPVYKFQCCNNPKNALNCERNNIDLTTHLTGSKPTVRVLLEEAGLLEEFFMWHSVWFDIIISRDRSEYNEAHIPGIELICDGASYKILTNFKYLCQAVDSFLQEVLNGTTG